MAVGFEKRRKPLFWGVIKVYKCGAFVFVKRLYIHGGFSPGDFFRIQGGKEKVALFSKREGVFGGTAFATHVF